MQSYSHLTAPRVNLTEAKEYLTAAKEHLTAAREHLTEARKPLLAGNEQSQLLEGLYSNYILVPADRQTGEDRLKTGVYCAKYYGRGGRREGAGEKNEN